jgi:excisionase family DNA binding protein
MTSNTLTTPSIYTVEEVATFLRVSEESVLRTIREGRLRAIKVGRTQGGSPEYRILQADLDAFLSEDRGVHTAEEVANFLGLNKVTVYRYIREGRLKATRTGSRNYRITQRDLDEFIAKNRTATEEDS